MSAIVDVLTTGGTISLRSDSTGAADRDAGYAPGDLAASLGLPDVVVRFRAVLDKGSKDIEPADWQVLARAVADAARGDADGVVVLHGTDTMHYTASALSFMVRGLPVPVVLTGSMVPGGDPGSDAPANLRDAVLVAATADLAEVCVVFAGKVLRGNRSRKVHSTGVDAFTSVNFPPLGTVEDGKVLLTGAQVPRQARQVELSADLDPDVVLVKLTPTVDGPRLARLLAGASGAVLEGTGVGHLKDELHAVVAEFGRPTVVTTQVERGGERLGGYASDRHTLALPNVLRGGDMTGEAALVKLMWALRRNENVRQLMLAEVAGERAAVDLMDDI